MEVNIFGEGAVGYKNIVKSSSSQDFFLYKFSISKIHFDMQGMILYGYI